MTGKAATCNASLRAPDRVLAAALPMQLLDEVPSKAGKYGSSTWAQYPHGRRSAGQYSHLETEPRALGAGMPSTHM